MNLIIQKLTERSNIPWRLRALLCACIAGICPANGWAADFSGSFSSSNMEISVYSKNSLEPDAVWRINRVSPQHRRMGFFSVKLLPVLVVEGIRLDFAKSGPQTNWLEGFRCEWAPAANQELIEWRDFSIFFPQETVPRLHAKRVHPEANAGSLICRLEGVTLQTGARPIQLSRAEVRAEGRSAAVVWRDAAATVQWDLFSGQFTTNAITQGIQNEKS
jgi:hypothetical protein